MRTGTGWHNIHPTVTSIKAQAMPVYYPCSALFWHVVGMLILSSCVLGFSLETWPCKLESSWLSTTLISMWQDIYYVEELHTVKIILTLAGHYVILSSIFYVPPMEPWLFLNAITWCSLLGEFVLKNYYSNSCFELYFYLIVEFVSLLTLLKTFCIA